MSVPAAAPEAGRWPPVAPGHHFGPHTLPYGAFTSPATDGQRVGVAIGEHILDLTGAAPRLLGHQAHLFIAGTLDPLLAAGPAAWKAVRDIVTGLLTDARDQETVEPFLVPARRAVMQLPFTVADYVDFYASEHHATNLGRMFRPDSDPLTPNWKHLPIGYHGRAGTVVVSGTPITRPLGQVRDNEGNVVLAPSARLDIEAELGFVVGVPTLLGTRVPLNAFDQHVFGVCLVNDWSARDIQALEYVPLGPFLGKSFGTSIGPWVVPLAALDHARVAPPRRDVPLLPHLDDTSADPWGLQVDLEVRLNGHLISEPPFESMYWTAAQQLAHLTSNGAALRTGDLFASGTISGPLPAQRGSLIELSWNGSEPFAIGGGRTRTFLQDGDEVVITASAPGPGGAVIGLGEVRGTIAAADLP